MSTAEMAAIFAALGDPTRLQLVMRLSDGRALSIAALAGGTGLSRQGVTKHLRVLTDGGLITARRQGRETHYTIRPETLAGARASLAAIERQWEAALERLRLLVEG